VLRAAGDEGNVARDVVSKTLAGSLEYQACDDKTCFNPVSLPLTWTMGLKALVTERPTRPQP